MVLTALATTIVLSLAAQGVPSGGTTAATQVSGVASTAAKSSTRSSNFPTFGDTGDDVVRLQQAMVARGFTLKGGIDGQFSARTQATLRNMQRAVGLK
ncbi:MAG: peptidoglycan-binding domain-containing protein, partial [Ilumatobacteraceae bacterium]